MLLRPEQVRGSGLSLRKAGPGGSLLSEKGRREHRIAFSTETAPKTGRGPPRCGFGGRDLGAGRALLSWGPLGTAAFSLLHPKSLFRVISRAPQGPSSLLGPPVKGAGGGS